MKIIEFFSDAYGKKPAVAARAPGRLEILGNHTDYNEGLVLSAAVSQATEFALLPIPGRQCTIRDFRDGSKVEFDLDEIDKPRPGDWSNYVKGVIVELRKRGYEIGAFEAAVFSTLPLSAGMSSSAALEISAGFALGAAFGIKLPKEEWAKIGQCSENRYIGVNTGLLDQLSSVFGQENALIYADFRLNRVLRNVAMPEGYVIIVANSMIKHNLVDSEYNARRKSCERAAACIGAGVAGVKTLRDVSTAMLEELKGKLDFQDYRRAMHVVGENERVARGVELLADGRIEAFGQLWYESHRSSREFFENSTPELDYLVELAQSIPGCVGARLSGGGFGGISIHLVKDAVADEYTARLQTGFKLRTGIVTETIKCSIGAGASVISVK